MSHEDHAFRVKMALLLGAMLCVGFVWLRGWLKFKWISHKFAPRPGKSVEVPGIGLMTHDLRSTLWSGELAELNVRVCLGGTKDRPDETLIRNLKSALQNLPQLKHQAVDLLINSDELKSFELVPALEKLTLLAIDFLWEEKPAAMSMAFGHADDQNGNFRVDFEGWKPVAVGYED